MIKKAKQHIFFCFLGIVSAIFLIAVTGFFRDISASGDETYRQLKIFSDVLEHIEEGYVDTVDTKDLIQKAIQGMVDSLDPHSMYIPASDFQRVSRSSCCSACVTIGPRQIIGVSSSTRKPIDMVCTW